MTLEEELLKKVAELRVSNKTPIETKGTDATDPDPGKETGVSAPKKAPKG